MDELDREQYWTRPPRIVRHSTGPLSAFERARLVKDIETPLAVVHRFPSEGRTA